MKELTIKEIMKKLKCLFQKVKKLEQNSGQVNTDWNATSGPEELLNKPTLYENTYSTDETVIGKWIDDKPLYRKVIEFTNLIQDGSLVHNLSIDSYVHVSIIEISPAFVEIGKRSVAGNGFDLSSNSIDEITDGVNDPINGYAIIEYTKTTD